MSVPIDFRPRHRILVVANETARGDELHDAVLAQAGRAGPQARVLVVASALSSRLRHWFSDDADARPRRSHVCTTASPASPGRASPPKGRSAIPSSCRRSRTRSAASRRQPRDRDAPGGELELARASARRTGGRAVRPSDHARRRRPCPFGRNRHGRLSDTSLRSADECLDPGALPPARAADRPARRGDGRRVFSARRTSRPRLRRSRRSRPARSSKLPRSFWASSRTAGFATRSSRSARTRACSPAHRSRTPTRRRAVTASGHPHRRVRVRDCARATRGAASRIGIAGGALPAVGELDARSRGEVSRRR